MSTLSIVEKVVLYVIEKIHLKNVLVEKNTYKRVRANTRARNLSPSSNEITTGFFLHHRVPGINAELPTSGILRSCSLPREGYANVANRDFGQDLRFLRDARESRKTPTEQHLAHALELSSCKVSRADVHHARRR